MAICGGAADKVHQRPVNQLLSLDVERRGGLVEHQNARLARMARAMVDLPAPECTTSPTISPGAMSSDRSRTAGVRTPLPISSCTGLERSDRAIAVHSRLTSMCLTHAENLMTADHQTTLLESLRPPPLVTYSRGCCEQSRSLLLIRERGEARVIRA